MAIQTALILVSQCVPVRCPSCVPVQLVSVVNVSQCSSSFARARRRSKRPVLKRSWKLRKSLVIPGHMDTESWRRTGEV
jgi:hypothetical protein